MAKKIGRPTKLNKAMREQTAAYLQSCIDNDMVPTHAGLAVELDVAKATLYNWAESNEEFLDTLQRIKTLQESTLIQGSLTNKLNATIAKLMLANHGYSDKSTQEHSFSFNKDNKTKDFVGD